MYKKSSSFVFKIASFLTLLFMLGCAASPQQISSSNYNIEIVKSDDLRLDHISISKNRNGNGITVKGDIHDIQIAGIRPKGHIDVDIVDHKGQILHKKQTNLSRLNRFNQFERTNRLYKKYIFKLEVPHIPADGSTIRLSYHPSKNEGNKNH